MKVAWLQDKIYVSGMKYSTHSGHEKQVINVHCKTILHHLLGVVDPMFSRSHNVDLHSVSRI